MVITRSIYGRKCGNGRVKSCSTAPPQKLFLFRLRTTIRGIFQEEGFLKNGARTHAPAAAKAVFLGRVFFFFSGIGHFDENSAPFSVLPFGKQRKSTKEKEGMGVWFWNTVICGLRHFLRCYSLRNIWEVFWSKPSTHLPTQDRVLILFKLASSN